MPTYRNELIINLFQDLFFKKYGKVIKKNSEIKPGASLRKIYRLSSGELSAIGISNENVLENEAFISFTTTFHINGFNVPEIYFVSDDRTVYLEEDLGSVTLNDIINTEPDREKVISLCKNAISELVKMQNVLKDKIDYTKCYQTTSFDSSVVRNDIEKFNKFYAANSGLTDFNVECVIQNYSDLLSRMNKGYFLYRDFQSRNIMLNNDRMYFIDYQSGRKGPAYYDAASFIFSGSVEFTGKEKMDLISYYRGLISEFETDKLFEKYFYEMAFLRSLQLLGSYAYSYFNNSVDWVLPKFKPARENLDFIIKRLDNGVLVNEGNNILESKLSIN